MTSAWGMLTITPAVGREDAVARETIEPDAERPDRSGPGSSGRINGTVAPPRVVADGPDPYLAPALRAAAAARAHTARIRAAQPQPVARSLAERLPEVALPADAGPQPCGPGTGIAAATTIAADARGLSVAAAARASTVAFRPLRRSSAPLLQDADPVSVPAAPAAPAPLPVDPGPRPAPRRAEPQRRFAKTIAEVERYRAATQGNEPGAHVVPSPVLARPDLDETAGAPWSRLWSRRKGPPTE
jgi:hypothetical protein